VKCPKCRADVLGDYLVDKHEVTNRQFKTFIDQGGYEKREYWTHSFKKDGRTIPWEQAMAEFRDRTGRPGPATWEMSDYPDGRDDHPVGGVSWYEAAAYAEFVGKSLPTIYHWDWAADPWMSDPRSTNDILSMIPGIVFPGIR